MKDLEKHLNDFKFYLLKAYEEQNLSSEVINSFYDLITKDINFIKEYWYNEEN